MEKLFKDLINEDIENSLEQEIIKNKIEIMLSSGSMVSNGLFNPNAKNIHVFNITATEVYIGFNIDINFYFTQIPINYE